MTEIVPAPSRVFRKLRGKRTADTPVALALSVSQLAPAISFVVRAVWTSRAARLFQEIARQAKASGEAAGNSLPYASLRAVLQVRLPGALLLSADLGGPWRGPDGIGPLLEADGTTDAIGKAVKGAFAIWVSMVLGRWAERTDVGEDIVDALAACVADGEALSFEEFHYPIAKAVKAGERFETVKQAILGLVGRRLEGQELFEGLGPVQRIVRGYSGGNAIEFQTWPVRVEGSDASYSMTATLALETQPYGGGPVLTVRASRRRWMAAIPDSRKLRQRRLTVYLMGRKRGPQVVECLVDLDRGVPDEAFSAVDPAFMARALEVGVDLGSTLGDMIARTAGDIFVGIPHSPRYGAHRVGAGASTRDNLDLFDAVSGMLAADGFEPLAFRDVGKSPARAENFFKYATVEMLIGDIARVLGHNDVTERAVLDALDILVVNGTPATVDRLAVQKAETSLQAIREANGQKIDRVFIGRKPVFVLVARTERERQVMRDCLQSLFGNSVSFRDERLPDAVHGPAAALPGAGGKARERFRERVEAWRPLARSLADEHEGCHVLVQAANWYDGKPDDPVNKLAGRCALATEADANVQYLLPPTDGLRGLKEYLNRIQSAAYDLVFGHSGLVTEIGGLTARMFPDASTRPKAVMGISVIAQARVRGSGLGGKICLATRIDVASGETTGRIGWFQSHMRWSSSWKPFFDILKDVAELNVTSLGDNREAEKTSFEKFVRAMLDEAAAAGDRPLVVIDSTSASGLWSWLSDDQISGPVSIGGERVDMSGRWTGVRIVRVRMRRAGRIAVRKSSSVERVDCETLTASGPAEERYVPTVTSRTIKVGTGDHFWATSSYLDQMTRGLSVYRPLTGLVKAAEADCADPRGLFREVAFDWTDKPYRLPYPIEITVARLEPGDRADLVAWMVDSLRYGYGHTMSMTALPAPLSFGSKVRDYMARFALDEADLADELPPEGPADIPAEIAADTAQGDEPETEDPPPEGNSDGTVLPQWTDALFPSRPGGVPAPESPFAALLAAADNPVRNPSARAILLGSSSETTAMNGFQPIKPFEPAADPSFRSVQAPSGDNPGEGGTIVPPAFVSLEWLRQRISLPNSRIRQIHETAEKFLAECPDMGWPRDRKPTQEEALAIFLSGFSKPPVFAALLRSGRANPKALFHRFDSRVNEQLVAIARARKRPLPKQAGDVVSFLCDHAEYDLASDFAVIFATFSGHIGSALDAVRRKPKLAEAARYLGELSAYWRDLDAAIERPAISENEDASRPEMEQTMDDAAIPDFAGVGEVETASIPALPEAAPEPVITVAGTAVDAWRRAIEHLIEACADVPSVRTASLLQEIASSAMEAAISYEASLPKFEEVAPFVVRLSVLAASLPGADQIAVLAAAIEAGAMISADKVEGVESLTSTAEGLVSRIRQADIELQAMWEKRDTSLFASIQSLQDEKDSWTLEAESIVHRALVAIAALSAALAPDHPREPPTGSGGGLRSSAGASEISGAEVAEAPAVSISSMSVAGLEVEQDEGMGSAAPVVPKTLDQPVLEMDEGYAAEAADPAGFADADADALMSLADSRSRSGSSEDDIVGDDPEVRTVADRLVELFKAGEFGIAWHLLRAAGKCLPGAAFPFTLPELALAATAGRINHPSAAVGGEVDALIADGLENLNELSGDGGEAHVARALCLFLSTAELALFQSNHVALQLLDSAFEFLSPELRSILFPLKEAIAKSRTSGVAISPAMMRAANNAEGAATQNELAREQVAVKVDAIRNLSFPFIVGIYTCTEMCKPSGQLGGLRAAMEQGGDRAVEAAKMFVASYSTHSEVSSMVVACSREVSLRDPIDGPARDRLVGHVLDVAALCGDFVAAAEAAREGTNSGRLAILQRVRIAVRAAAVAVAGNLKALAARDDGILAATAVTMSPVVRHFIAVLDGAVRQPGQHEDRAALHGSMLMIPAFDYGRSWLPAPYDPSQIVAETMDLELPVLPPAGSQRDARFAAAIRERIRRGSFGGARFALSLSGPLSIGDRTADELRSECDAEQPTRRDCLHAAVEKAHRSVERVQRLGEGATPDDCQSLLARLDMVSKAQLPALVELEARTTEEELTESVVDFSSAEQVVEDVHARARAMLAEPRREIDRRLQLMGERLESDDVKALKSLLDDDDLITARERLDIVEQGGRMPRTQSAPNRRFAAFFPRVPDFVSKMSAELRDELPTRIADGTDVGPLEFSRIAVAGRPDAKTTYDMWRKLPRHFAAGDAENRVSTAALEILGRFNFVVKSCDIDRVLTKKQKHIHVANVRLEFPADDAENMLLPDYGSRTNGHYRLVVATMMPSEAVITDLSDTAGVTATIMLVVANVGAERRRELTKGSASLQGGRKILVIDESLFLYALSEPELRPLTLLECAQPFGSAQPFGDYGRYARVPPEMFVGRIAEYGRVLAADGSCVVYGGRRLGKTALLKHLEARENKPEDGVVVAHVDIYNIGRSEQAVKLWHVASQCLAAASASGGCPIFREVVNNKDDFDRKVREWLHDDSRRRILLLLDEADEFVKADTKRGFPEFTSLQKLMDETNRRFKFVLAGLHNVTRMVQAENSPLRQIAYDPQRIGPMMGSDLPEAERLIVKPLASLGYVFERREDVWSILSATNYYPVLAQTLCATLLDELREETRQTGRVDWKIRPAVIRRLIQSDKVLPSIKEKFEHTIKELDPRYELLTYVIAASNLRDQQEGRIDEGMTSAGIRDDAVRSWPNAFERLNRLSVIEALLDEMEGLGVVRQVKGDRWTLRSPSILALLGTRDRVASELAEFKEREVPQPFEPGAMRRSLTQAGQQQGEREVMSPLTYGQEHDLLTDRKPVTVVFGSPAGDIDNVGTAIQHAAADKADRRNVRADVRNWKSCADLVSAIKAVRDQTVMRNLFVVTNKSDWNGDWILEVAKLKGVRELNVRVVFAGGPVHAMLWVTDPRFRRLPPALKVVTLETWTASTIDDLATRLDVPADRARALMIDRLGGYNRNIRRVVADLGQRPTLTRLEKAVETRARGTAQLDDLGLDHDMASLFRRMPEWTENGSIPHLYVRDGVITEGTPEGRDAEARRILEFGQLMGLLEPGEAGGRGEDERTYALNPFLLCCLRATEATA